MKDESKKIDVSRREAAQWGEINFKVKTAAFIAGKKKSSNPKISYLFFH